MSITAYSQIRLGEQTLVTVTSDLEGVVYYHWFRDGVYLGVTSTPSRTFYLEEGEQARIEVTDTNDADYDAPANAPDAWPARRLIWWTAATDTDVARYRVEQQQDGGAWETLATVHHRANQWQYSALTGRLDDLSTYAWRVVPIDAAGNDGTELSIGEEKIVRRPDAPEWDYTFSEETTKITVSEAA